MSDLFAQKITVAEYIDTYKDWAISEMKRSGIPASIKLGQGILESGFGNSKLATEANNHFGIKCGSAWKGEVAYHDDDKKNECFRKYKDAKESYTDHTNFLTNNKRYASLFEYKSTDYKSWAKGLSKAGYATDPNYPQKLIELIERHELHVYDTGVSSSKRTSTTSSRTRPTSAKDDFATFNLVDYPIRENNRTSYVLAKEGDTYTSLSVELDMMPWQLPRYNEAKASDKISEGDIIYIQPKRRKAEKGKETHTVSGNETMYSISQTYAVKVARLYTLNRMEKETEPNAGDVLNLRKKKK